MKNRICVADDCSKRLKIANVSFKKRNTIAHFVQIMQETCGQIIDYNNPTIAAI
jgi:hypothetical protein